MITACFTPRCAPKKNNKDRREGKRSSLLVKDVLYLNIEFSRKDDFNKSFWENLHFGRVVVWYGVNRMIIHFSKASIPPSSRYFSKIILVENSKCGKEFNKFRPPNSSDDLCLLFCLYPSSLVCTNQKRCRVHLLRLRILPRV